MPLHSLHPPVLRWYSRNARDLPWRRPEAGPWAVLVSEAMLQQTPVVRVLGPYEAWLRRWPNPLALANDSAGEAVRLWGRLGYPRRALRLHEAAVICVEHHQGEVPSDVTALRALPGVGSYTAAAVASFAFRQRHAVLDTNVRRVLARVVQGEEYEPGGAPSGFERRSAETLLPDSPDVAATWAAALMELGALVCTARSPRCEVCPIADQCTWNRAGQPAWTGAKRRGQSYAGTDRQARGRLLAVLRDARSSVPAAELEAVWTDPVQRARALSGLIEDGLAEEVRGGRYRLPR
jgi:A/G-specific adenine glycosylase